MWEVSETVVVQSSTAMIWALWNDVEQWNIWDAGVQWSRLGGPFAVGTQGRLKPVHGPASKFTITRVEEQQGFDDVSSLPLCRLEFCHRMVSTPAGVQLTHTIRMVGPFTFLFSRLIGKHLANDLRPSVVALAQLAEQRAGVSRSSTERAP